MIRNIWAVGRNYQAHAKEMGAATPTKPMIFLKAGSSVVMDQKVSLFPGSNEIHHEIEIALRFGARPELHFDAVALALDLTARDLQAELKAQGHPWTLAKSFRESCPMSSAVEFSGPVPHFEFELSVNKKIRQRGRTQDMIFDFEKLRAYVLSSFPVEPGDWLLTGTPEGVARLEKGDHAQASARAVSAAALELSGEWFF